MLEQVGDSLRSIGFECSVQSGGALAIALANIRAALEEHLQKPQVAVLGGLDERHFRVGR